MSNRNNVFSENSGFFGNYRNLIITITILIVLVVSLLLLNLFFSNQLQKSSNTTSIAEQQVTLVQQISRDLLAILLRFQNGLNYEDDKDSLKKTLDLFDERINVFAYGGTVMEITETHQELIDIDEVQGEEAVAIVEEALKIWEGYLRTSAPLFEKQEFEFTDLFWANDYSNNNVERLSELMSNLSDIVRSQAETNINYLKSAQLIGIVLVMVMFFWVIVRTLRNLRSSDRKLWRAQQEITGMMNTVKEGLFLVDEDLIVSSQYSNETEQIFETSKIGGEKFTDLMRDILPLSGLDTIENFIKLLFDSHILADLTEGLNPLEQVEVNYVRRDGTNVLKYLNFDFYQVIENDVIQGVLVSVRDITDEILLEEQLKESKEKGNQQADMLMSFLHADPEQLEQFLMASRNSLSNVNDILKENVIGKKDFKEKIEKIFVEVHRVKGEASSMNIDTFAQKAHEFEEELAKLRKSEYIEGLDFLPMTVHLDEMLEYLDSLAQLLSRIKQYSAGENQSAISPSLAPAEMSIAPVIPISSSPKWSYLTNTSQKVADDLGKKVLFTMSGLDESNLTPVYSHFINDVGIQIIRNSIVHGIETPEERIRKSKSEIGHVSLDISQQFDRTIKCLFRDDGQGLNITKIREKIIGRGFSTKEDIDSWSIEKIAKVAFVSGFSTQDKANMHAGRGVGLSVIQERVKNMGGKLTIRHKEGVFCELEIILPPQQYQSVSSE